MRPVRVLLIYLAVVFLGGALLAPWLYFAAQALAPQFPSLANSPFHRYVNRALLLLALAGIWPLLRNLGATSLREAGWVSPRGQWRRLGTGVLLGFVTLAVVAGSALLLGARQFNDTLSATQVAARLASATLTAVAVSLLEETLFRGGVFGGLRRVLDWRFALGLSSVIFGLVHFLASAKLAGPVTWLSGLELLPRMLRGFAHWEAIVPGFFNLALAGGLLALAYQRTGNLWFSFGLHAGWILWLKSYGEFTHEVAGASLWFWGSSRLIDGWVALGVLGGAFVLLARRPPTPPAGLRP